MISISDLKAEFSVYKIQFTGMSNGQRIGS